MRQHHVTIVSVVTVIAMVLFSFFVKAGTVRQQALRKIKVGFIYDGDVATPYTANFMRAEEALHIELGDAVETESFTNVRANDAEDFIRQLVNDGCQMVFTNSFGYSETAKKMATEFPNVTFCQATGVNANEDPVLPNYHTFMGEIYEGRYIAGIVAGMKLQDLIHDGSTKENEAVVGYVGAYPYAEVISGYTAFFLGVRSIVPTATMKVVYTYTWNDYHLEREYAKKLIDEGCVMISQHSDTIGPAVACEEAKTNGKTVYHVGYNQSMISVAPTTSLVSSRINWNPYIVGAVEALMAGEQIEESVPGHVHGNDIGAGFEKDWVQIMELNDAIASPHAESSIEKLIEDFKSKNPPQVFKGNYIGVNPEDPSDTIDLSQGYTENETTSAPQFYYVLQDVIEIEE